MNKLKIDAIKVKSFVTSLDDDTRDKTIKGGVSTRQSIDIVCIPRTEYQTCWLTVSNQCANSDPAICASEFCDTMVDYCELR